MLGTTLKAIREKIMGLFNWFANENSGPSNGDIESNIENNYSEKRHEELFSKIKEHRLSDDEFQEFNSLEVQKQRNELNKFSKGKNNFFDDNDLYDNEIEFFRHLVQNMKDHNLNPNLIRLNRLSDKTINVRYLSAQIGRIKLYGRKTSMQILSISDLDTDYLENAPFEEYGQKTIDWVTYILALNERKQKIQDLLND